MKYRRLRGHSDAALREALGVLRQGGIILFPTDTVYGIGGDATRPAVARRIRRMKGRPARKPFPWLASDLSMAKRFGFFSEPALRAARRAWPGPVTFVVPVKKKKRVTVALRVPAHPWLRRLIRQFGKPIIGTSANRSGMEPAMTARKARAMLPTADLVIDGGKCVGTPSRIISWTSSGPRILR